MINKLNFLIVQRIKFSDRMKYLTAISMFMNMNCQKYLWYDGNYKKKWYRYTYQLQKCEICMSMDIDGNMYKVVTFG